jgi:hypothetical protein
MTQWQNVKKNGATIVSYMVTFHFIDPSDWASQLVEIILIKMSKLEN